MGGIGIIFGISGESIFGSYRTDGGIFGAGTKDKERNRLRYFEEEQVQESGEERKQKGLPACKQALVSTCVWQCPVPDPVFPLNSASDCFPG